jgi:hypothetical protein
MTNAAVVDDSLDLFAFIVTVIACVPVKYKKEKLQLCSLYKDCIDFIPFDGLEQ